jgi:hypothetical protein
MMLGVEDELWRGVGAEKKVDSRSNGPNLASLPDIDPCLPPRRCASQQEQGNKSRIRGIEAQKANIHAAKAVALTLRSSLGPKVSCGKEFAKQKPVRTFFASTRWLTR